MKYSKFVLLFTVLAVSTALADDFKTTGWDGKEYKGVSVTKVEPDGITVMTDSGIEKLPFSKLPKDVQEKYHYDPAAANAYIKQEDAAVARRNEINQEVAAGQMAAQNQQSATDASVAAADAKPKTSFTVIVGQAGSGGTFVKVLNTVSSGAPDTIFVTGMAGVAQGERYDISAYRDGIYNGDGDATQKWVCVKMAKNVPVYARPGGGIGDGR